MSSFRKLLWLLLPWVPLWVASGEEAERLIILANSASEDSLSVAQFYAEARSVPKSNISALPMSEEETISIEEYVETIHNPLLEALLERGFLVGGKASSVDASGRSWLRVGFHDISYLVPVYGVPLRISNSLEIMAPDTGQMPTEFRVNRASVDSELALLATPGRRSMAAYSSNLFFAEKQPSKNLLQTVLRVSRLDGPSVKTVRSLIERTLEGEAAGLQGRAYFDISGPHEQGDQWFRKASQLVKDASFDMTIETTRRVLDERDRFDAPAIYMGWYRLHAYGNFKIPNWDVPPGALALHLHSFSASTLRNVNRNWLAALVRMGFCATVGNVYEPYLSFTHHPHLLVECLLEGGTFGEAVAYSVPAWSWMGVAIGDPLYRPFEKKLEAQLESKITPYVILREANRIAASKGSSEATTYLRKEFQKAPSLPLAYALASRYLDAGNNKEAKDVLRLIQYITKYAKEDQVLVQRLADLLALLGETEMALKVYEKLIAEDALAKPFRISLLTGGSKLARKWGKSRLADDWDNECLILKIPKEKQ